MKSNLRKQNGFTLVEMAIVVVLGGILLAAGLVAGRGLISRAQTQDVIQIASDLQAGANGFKLRYGYLPGDWPYVANQLTGVAAASAGTNGDGVIDGAITIAGAAAPNSETADATFHLYAAGLLTKVVATAGATIRIKSPFGAVHMASNVAANTVAAYVATYPSVKNVILFYSLPCEIALEVDRTLDDGNITTGRARGSAGCAVPDGVVPRYYLPL